MVHQTQVTMETTTWTAPDPHHGNHRSAASGVRDGVGELLHDVVSLGELQAQLLAVDARESVQHAKLPIALVAIGAVLGLGCVPVLLLAMGEAFYELLDWPRSLSYLASGVIAALAGGLLLWLGIGKFNAVIGVFKRSSEELSENVRWVKYALTRGRRPPR
jgi:hypothetical protein